MKPLIVQIQVPSINSSSSLSSSPTSVKNQTSSSSSFSPLPLGPRILQVSSRKHHEIECRTWGSRPPAEVTWWRGSRRLPTASSKTTYTNSDSHQATSASGSEVNNLTVSILSYVPEPEDDGQRLTCRADNLQLTNEELEDSVIISVKCKLHEFMEIFSRETRILPTNETWYKCNSI